MGELSLDQVTRRRLEGFVGDLVRQGAGPRMIRGTVRDPAADARGRVDWGRIEANPARRLRLPAPDTHAAQAVEQVLDGDGFGASSAPPGPLGSRP